MITHSPSSTVADRPPAMYRSATTAIVVSSTSMKVGTMTTAATSHGFTSACDLDGRKCQLRHLPPPGVLAAEARGRRCGCRVL